jgi:hypothetical protein
MHKEVARLTILLSLCALGGCATWHYTMACGTTTVDVTSTGFAYTRTVGDIKLTSKECGSAEVKETQTDTEKAFEAGVAAGKSLIGAALKP